MQKFTVFAAIAMALFFVSASAVQWTNELTAEDKSAILGFHNYYRSNIGQLHNNTMAKNMNSLEWDETLAQHAALWASTCPEDHQTGISEGENIAFDTPTGYFDNNWGVLFEYWFVQEGHHWSHDTHTCRDNEECGHYAQMVWAAATKVGCAIKKNCKKVTPLNENDGDVVVCRYDQRVVEGVSPFEVAKSQAEIASNCPTGRTRQANLCVPDGTLVSIPSNV